LKIEELSAQTISTANNLAADAVIYPPTILGTLAERKLIRPLNRAWFAADPLAASDLLQPPDSLEFTWDGQLYAVPLGSPVFVLLYRSDLFETFNKKPPRTWEDYQQLAEFFSNAAELKKRAKDQHSDSETLLMVEPWSALVEPLSPGWAARMLLARAAPYAKHRDYISVLFDRQTMEPFITGPPFVRALSELAAAAKLGPKDAMSLTPTDATRLLLAGHAAMAIGWPSRAVESPSESDIATAKVPIAIVEVPGASDAYNPRHNTWEQRWNDETTSIPLRGMSGRVGSVVRGSDSAEPAFHFLTWLASKRWSNEVLPVSSAITMFRQSQQDDPMPWTGPALSAGAAKLYGQALTAALRQPEAIWMPRIPGEAQYMAALDEAVYAALAGKQSAQQALDDAAAKWRQITARLGREQQLEAYRRSLKAAQQ
jgi:multiple sugar transport system substrate-binding protein